MCTTLNHTFSQNKKEQIDVLYVKLDSLNQLLTSERNISLNAISELNIKNVDFENQLNSAQLELKSLEKKVTEIEIISKVKSDSLSLLSSERPEFFIVKESLVIEGEEDVQEGVNEIFYERLSIPSNVALEKKINEIIFVLHNFNSNGYACDLELPKFSGEQVKLQC